MISVLVYFSIHSATLKEHVLTITVNKDDEFRDIQIFHIVADQVTFASLPN